jgi:hypothetical protein
VSNSHSPGASPGRGPLVIVLAIIGVLGIIGGILYISGAANSIHFIDGSVYKGNHHVRAIVSFVVGIAFLVMAYIAKTRPATAAGRANAAGSATAAGRPNAAGSAAAAGPAGATGPTGPADPAGPAGPASPASGSGGSTTPSGS